MSDAPPSPGGPAPEEPHPFYPTRRDARLHDLKGWFVRHRSAYTSNALEASAIAAGYTQEEFRAAVALAESERESAEAVLPTRTVARRVILVAYGLVWALFAIPYLFWDTMYGFGPLAQGILTIVLGLALAGSWVWTRRTPDPANAQRAMAVLLSVPMVLLLVFGGLCLPFVPRG